MSGFKVVSLDAELGAEVRQTLRSPGYGHPVASEVASGTGPCRSCLQLFDVGRDERLLFTYQPSSGTATVGAPGPVFIHAEECARFTGPGLPPDLLALPLLVEGRTHDGRVPRSERTNGTTAEAVIRDVLAEDAVDFIHLRHGEAGCHIAVVRRD